MLGFVTVPDSQVWIVTCLQARPDLETGRKTKPYGPFPGVVSEVAEQGLHWYLPAIHQVVNALPVDPQNVYLWRHEDDAPGDFAQIELSDVTVQIRVVASVRLKRNPVTKCPNHADVLSAHYNSMRNDFLRQTEYFLNPLVREVFQGRAYSIDTEALKLHPPDTASSEEIQAAEEHNRRIDEGIANLEVEFTGVENLKQTQLLSMLGLQYSEREDGPLEAIDGHRIGNNIIRQLSSIGVELVMINLQDINLPEEVDEARQQIAVAKAQGEADLEREKINFRVIDQRARNQVREAEGNAEALRVQADGFMEAVNQAYEKGEGTVTREYLVQLLGDYPALQRIVSEKAQFFFQGNGRQSLVQDMVQAIKAAATSEQSI